MLGRCLVGTWLNARFEASFAAGARRWFADLDATNSRVQDALGRSLLGWFLGTGNVFWASKYAWPHLQAAEGAAIVNISSGQSLAGFTGFSAYAAAKGAMNSTTRVLAGLGIVTP